MAACFIVIAGNIGVGKSTLTALLAQRLGWAPFYEPNADNPYLADFYQDMQRWSFHAQVSFLSQRVAQHKALLERGQPAVLDRSVYEDAEVFACNLYQRGALSERDWVTYQGLYRTMSSLLRLPDLVVYLRASVPTLMRRIAQRGRDYERDIAPDYLTALNKLYEQWIGRFDACATLTVDTDDLDFVTRSRDQDAVIGQITRALAGCLQGQH
jgi:deoxyadenosine/deoxycytidine kinase